MSFINKSETTAAVISLLSHQDASYTMKMNVLITKCMFYLPVSAKSKHRVISSAKLKRKNEIIIHEAFEQSAASFHDQP